MLKIRLQRIGKRGQAYFRVVIVEHTKKPKGKFLELLGNYDPHKKEFKVKMERVNYWVSNGAQVSPTVNNLMVNYKIWDKPKMASWKPKKQSANRKAQSAQAENQKQEVPEAIEEKSKEGESHKQEEKSKTDSEEVST